MKKIFAVIGLITFLQCHILESDKNEKRLEDQAILTTLLLIDLKSKINNDSIFSNYNFDFAVNREQDVNGNSERSCVNVFKLKNNDPETIKTGYESDERTSRCNKVRDVDFICMTDLTFYTSFHYFEKSTAENPDLLEYCRDELKGIRSFF